jgi:hypothetical protein
LGKVISKHVIGLILESRRDFRNASPVLVLDVVTTILLNCFPQLFVLLRGPGTWLGGCRGARRGRGRGGGRIPGSRRLAWAGRGQQSLALGKVISKHVLGGILEIRRDFVGLHEIEVSNRLGVLVYINGVGYLGIPLADGHWSSVGDELCAKRKEGREGSCEKQRGTK